MVDVAGRVYAVGVGPGSPKYLTDIAKEVISRCDVIVGYEYTLRTIRHLTSGKTVHTVTMSSQEGVLQKVAAGLGADQTLVVPFTGDASFSESEVIDRLVEIFGSRHCSVEIVPGISSIQVAAAMTGVPLDKSRVITMHITPSIEGKKREMREALKSGLSVILIPRPWPSRPDKHFMPSEAAAHLREHGFDTKAMRASVFEALTTEQQARFDGTVSELEGREFSDLCVVVFDQARPDSYMNYRWQWDTENGQSS